MKRHVMFGVYMACLMAAAAAPLRELVALSRGDESASHLVLIPLVTLVLIYQSRRSVFLSLRPAAGTALVVGLIGIGLLVLARFAVPEGHGDRLSLDIAALVALSIAGFIGFYGRAAFLAALFPLMFLAFTIPFPGALLTAAVQVLKDGSTEMVAILFNLTATPFHREGYVFALPNFVIEVADECSGIRSSIALLLTSLLAGHMFLRTWWSKALLVAVVLPLAILKNGIRIVSLSLLAEHVNPSYLTGQLHHEGGIVFFLLTIGILTPFFLLLQRWEAQQSPTAGSVQC